MRPPATLASLCRRRRFSARAGVGPGAATEAGAASAAAKPVAARPFAEMPGPRGPLGLGVLHQYLPLVGRYSWQALHRAGEDKLRRYGPIVRETLAPGQDVVWLFEPADIAALLGQRDLPQRRSHLALQKYRQDRPHVYRTAGLLPTNGREWWRLRSELQQELGAPQSVRGFLPAVDRVSREFVAQLPQGRAFDALPLLARLNLELTCLLTFGVRLGAFAPAELAPDSRSSRLIRAAETTNGHILPTDQGLQLWRRFETPAYRRLRRAQEYMEAVAVELVAQTCARARVRSGSASEEPSPLLGRRSLIEAYLANERLERGDVVGAAADLLLAGIDTSSYTTAFALHHVARHPEVQARLHAEARQVLPSDSASGSGSGCDVGAEALRSGVPYTRAVLKEVFRLNPISVGVGRVLGADLVLGGFLVPKGTVVVTQNMIACRQARFFPEPLRFDPDRWLRRRQEGEAAPSPFLVLPFGHGMRACIARRLAEQNILVLLLRIMRDFEVAWEGEAGPLDVRTLLINKPSGPVAIRLSRRPPTGAGSAH